MNKLVEIYCDVDDFCQTFLSKWEKQLLTSGVRKRRRAGRIQPRAVHDDNAFGSPLSWSRRSVNWGLGSCVRLW